LRREAETPTRAGIALPTPRAETNKVRIKTAALVLKSDLGGLPKACGQFLAFKGDLRNVQLRAVIELHV
jgi:hypothetical protein